MPNIRESPHDKQPFMGPVVIHFKEKRVRQSDSLEGKHTVSWEIGLQRQVTSFSKVSRRCLALQFLTLNTALIGHLTRRSASPFYQAKRKQLSLGFLCISMQFKLSIGFNAMSITLQTTRRACLISAIRTVPSYELLFCSISVWSNIVD